MRSLLALIITSLFVVRLSAAQSWVRAEDVPTEFVGATTHSALYVHDGLLYIGTLGYGVYASEDEGDTWHTLAAGLSGTALFIIDIMAWEGALYGSRSRLVCA